VWCATLPTTYDRPSGPPPMSRRRAAPLAPHCRTRLAPAPTISMSPPSAASHLPRQRRPPPPSPFSVNPSPPPASPPRPARFALSRLSSVLSHSLPAGSPPLLHRCRMAPLHVAGLPLHRSVSLSLLARVHAASPPAPLAVPSCVSLPPPPPPVHPPLRPPASRTRSHFHSRPRARSPGSSATAPSIPVPVASAAAALTWLGVVLAMRAARDDHTTSQHAPCVTFGSWPPHGHHGTPAADLLKENLVLGVYHPSIPPFIYLCRRHVCPVLI
jgi:hypothetical protein